MKNTLICLLAVLLLFSCENKYLDPSEIVVYTGELYEKGLKYPGAVGSVQPRLRNYELSIDLSSKVWKQLKISESPKEWHSTGLYAAPGEEITIVVPQGIKGVICRIGSSTCNLSSKKVLKRHPITWKTEELKPGENKLHHPFGGHIYIISQTYDGVCEFVITGAVKSPDFIYKQTDATEWEKELKETQVPWGELRSERIIITIPTSDLKQVKNPDSLMAWYNEVIELDFNDFWNLSDAADSLNKSPDFPWRMSSDIQVCAGAAHAGYPFMAGYSWGKRAADLDHLKKSDWGIYHEIGHNYQTYCWKPSYFVEVTCNLHSFHIHNRFGGWPAGKLKSFEWIVDNYVNKDIKDKDFAELYNSKGRWGQHLIEMITPFVQLAQQYSWGYVGYLGESSRNSYEEVIGNQGRMDFFAMRVTEYAGKNLLPFFDAWGMQLSTSTRMYISQFDEYKGDEFWTKFDSELIPQQKSDRKPIVKTPIHEEGVYTFAATYYNQFSEDEKKQLFNIGENKSFDPAFSWYGANYFSLFYDKNDVTKNKFLEILLPENNNDKWIPAVLESGKYKLLLSFRPFNCGVQEIYFDGKKIGEIDLSGKSGQDGQLFEIGTVSISNNKHKDHRLKIRYKSGGDQRLILYSIRLEKES